MFQVYGFSMDETVLREAEHMFKNIPKIHNYPVDQSGT